MNARSAHHDFAAAPNRNALWGELAVSEWGRLGLSLAVVCPGSRCAPLAHAVSRSPEIESLIAHDERAAGFVALGAARATGRAAMVITTSGTAVANLLPAVVEASQSATPLIIVTADRPAELHECGANQAIAQSRIFGEFARWSFDVPCADEAIGLEWVLSTADEAWHRAHGPSRPAGPVHLNWMFREPLAPRADHWDRSELASISDWIERREPWRRMLASTRTGQEVLDDLVARVTREQGDFSRALVSVGALYSPAMRAAARVITSALGGVVIADVGSGLRHGCQSHSVTAHADLITLSPAACERLRPEFIVRLGGGVSSRRVSTFLSESGARELLVRSGSVRVDATHSVRAEILLDSQEIDALAALGVPEIRAQSAEALEYTRAWMSAQERVIEVLDERLGDPEALLDEPSTARIVTSHCARGSGESAATLLIANSMPIRDADMHAARTSAPLTIAVNRGASGIDGLIATAVGHARATHATTTVHVGDLSLLHDLGSLALVRASPIPLVIVVVNNDGGGIFHFLPLADHPELLEPWATAPHGTSFEGVAHAFALHYEAPKTRNDLALALERARGRGELSNQSTLIEVTTDRSENLHFHKALQSAVRASLELSGALGVRPSITSKVTR